MFIISIISIIFVTFCHFENHSYHFIHSIPIFPKLTRKTIAQSSVSIKLRPKIFNLTKNKHIHGCFRGHFTKLLQVLLCIGSAKRRFGNFKAINFYFMEIPTTSLFILSRLALYNLNVYHLSMRTSA